jgi:RecA-family ATPase
MERGSPEEFFSQHGTTETFSPVFEAIPPVDEHDRWYEQEIVDPVSAVSSRRREVSQRGGETPQLTPIVPNLVYPTSLRGKPLPVMEWIVDQWIPMREVTLLYGDGGVGKTLLSQQLMASSSIGKPWCTLPVHRCKSIGVFCEDDNDELHRRQENIQRHLMTGFEDERLDAMCWWSRKGEDNLLCTFDIVGRIQPTALYEAIITSAKEHGAGLIILDTAADLFGGNENDRGQVRQFIGLLARMAMTCNAAVVLCAHPSRAGMSSGTMDSGSTGWSNSARSRLALERPKAEGDEQVDTDERILSKKKSNRSSIGDFVKLRWKDGVIAPTRAPGLTSSTVLADALDADRTFLAILSRCWEQGVYVTHSPNAGNFAPKVFAKQPDRNGFSAKEFDRAMQRLIADNVIRVESYKSPNRHIRDRLARVADDDDGGEGP